MNIPIIGDIYNRIVGEKNEGLSDPALIQPVDLSRVETPQFSEAFYRSLELNQKVDSKEDILKAISNSHLSSRCKSAFIDFVNTYYDRNVILSDLSGTHESDIAYLNSVVNGMVAIITNSYKSDRARPEYVRFWQLVRAQIWFRMTRTRGPDRERILSGKMTVRYESSQTLKSGKEEKR